MINLSYDMFNTILVLGVIRFSFEASWVYLSEFLAMFVLLIKTNIYEFLC